MRRAWAAALLFAGACGIAHGAACGGDPFVASNGLGGDGGNANDGGGSGDGAKRDGGSAGGDGATTNSDCGAVLVDREVCFPQSTFTMGSSAPNLGAGYFDHTPPHQVTLSPFVLDAFEVTVARYRECVDSSACTAPAATSTACTYSSAPGTRDDLPVLCVTWQQAVAFCEWDGNRRLPTEAQWERAARGASSPERDYPWGPGFDCPHAVLGGYAGGACPSYLGAVAIDSMPLGATPENVAQLAGNAAEWISDWAGSYPPGAVTDPQGPANGSVKVARGGAFSSQPAAGLGYSRGTADPASVGPWGMRCARPPR